MSQGESLAETSIGVFLDAILASSETCQGALEKAVLFRQELTALGREPFDILSEWESVERKVYRKERRPEDPEPTPHAIEILLENALLPLTQIEGMATGPVWTKALIKAAETIASRTDGDGGQFLWRGEAGESAARLLEQVIVYGDNLPDVDRDGFRRLLRQLMTGSVVRPRFGTHPRLSILGPLEARMLESDVVVLGGLNEGTWPATPSPGPFLSRGMRRDMKLSLPERRYGLAAHDFFELASNPSVYLTRSKRSLDQPNGPGEFGSAIHLGIENFLTANGLPLTETQDEALLRAFEKAFADYSYPPEFIAKEESRFRAIAEGLRLELNRRLAESFDTKGLEVKGEANIPGRDFTVRGVMDYVERGIEGYGFVDFKTGIPSTNAVVEAGFDPQLPLAAFILREGGLENHKAAYTAQLSYIQVKGANAGFKHFPIGKKKTVEQLVEEAVETLTKLIDRFDDPSTPYESQVRAQYINSWSDFDDLARRGEWAGMSGGETDV